MSDETTVATDGPEEAAFTTEPTTPSRLLEQLIAEIAALRESIDEVTPHLVATLKRNQAFDEILERLNRAEKQLAARHEAPMAVSLLRVLNDTWHMTHLQPETKKSLTSGLADGLVRAGYELIVPTEGDSFDPEKHEVLGNEAPSGQSPVVIKLESFGLRCGSMVISRAKVVLGPPAGEPRAEQSQPMEEQ